METSHKMKILYLVTKGNPDVTVGTPTKGLGLGDAKLIG